MLTDTQLAEMRDTLPRIWFALYQGCLDAGFDRTQALNLVETFILAQNPNGSRPPGAEGPESNRQ